VDGPSPTIVSSLAEGSPRLAGRQDFEFSCLVILQYMKDESDG